MRCSPTSGARALSSHVHAGAGLGLLRVARCGRRAAAGGRAHAHQPPRHQRAPAARCTRGLAQHWAIVSLLPSPQHSQQHGLPLSQRRPRAAGDPGDRPRRAVRCGPGRGVHAVHERRRLLRAAARRRQARVRVRGGQRRQQVRAAWIAVPGLPLRRASGSAEYCKACRMGRRRARGSRCLTLARRRRRAARRYTCADQVRRVAVFYGSTGTVDDQAWGALWLHKATRDAAWLNKVPRPRGRPAAPAQARRPCDGAAARRAGNGADVPEHVRDQALALVLQARGRGPARAAPAPGCPCAAATGCQAARAARSYDNVALGAFMLHAEAAPSSFSAQALAQHFTTDVLAYVQQPGHLTRGAAAPQAPPAPPSRADLGAPTSGRTRSAPCTHLPRLTLHMDSNSFAPTRHPAAASRGPLQG